MDNPATCRLEHTQPMRVSLVDVSAVFAHGMGVLLVTDPPDADAPHVAEWLLVSNN